MPVEPVTEPEYTAAMPPLAIVMAPVPLTMMFPPELSPAARACPATSLMALPVLLLVLIALVKVKLPLARKSILLLVVEPVSVMVLSTLKFPTPEMSA